MEPKPPQVGDYVEIIDHTGRDWHLKRGYIIAGDDARITEEWPSWCGPASTLWIYLDEASGINQDAPRHTWQFSWDEYWVVTRWEPPRTITDIEVFLNG